MPRRPIFTDVMDVLEKRIVQGDYMLKGLPGERKLAEEVGVSYMTARKAVQQLIDKKVLSRKANGALVIHEAFQDENTSPQVALLTPAYPSSHFVRCRLAISQAAEKRRIRFRPIEYVHWFDPIVSEALRGSDGLIVIPSTEPIPASLLREFSSPQRKVVFFDDDMTDHALPSIRLFATAHITRLFEHLWDLGHRRIDCLNAQGHNHEIDRRISHWRSWLGDRGGIGVLWDFPAPAFEDPTVWAYRAMRDLLRKPTHSLSAIVCTTQPTAIGAIRACHEEGLRVGRDVSICTINNEPTGRYFVPSLTGLELPDIEPLLDKVFTWFAEPSPSPWTGSARIVPERAKLLKGESTGLAPGTKSLENDADPSSTSAA